MVLANRPWLLLPGLKSALVAALTTGAIATINSTVWLLAGALSPWRLVVATVASLCLVVGWLVIDAHLWDHPDDDSAEARDRSRLYNTSTLLTLSVGVVICYIALYLLNLGWAMFVLDPAVMGGYLRMHFDHGDLFVLAVSSRRSRRWGARWAAGSSRTRPSERRRTRSVRRSAATGSRTNGPRR